MAGDHGPASGLHHQMAMGGMPPGTSPMHQLISSTKDIPPGEYILNFIICNL